MDHTATDLTPVTDAALIRWLGRIRDFLGSTPESVRYAQAAMDRLAIPRATGGLQAIAAQVAKNRAEYSADHDDRHLLAELTAAADCYVEYAEEQIVRGLGPLGQAMSPLWPFEPASWKPSEDPLRNLVHAGALIAAEIERLQRLRAKASVSGMQEA